MAWPMVATLLASVIGHVANLCGSCVTSLCGGCVLAVLQACVVVGGCVNGLWVAVLSPVLCALVVVVLLASERS